MPYSAYAHNDLEGCYDKFIMKNRDPRPQSLQAINIPFIKDDQLIWALDLPVETLPITDLIWHFDYPFWEKEGTDDWNLTPRALLDDPSREPTHYQQIKEADLSYPLQVMWHNGRWLLLDGLHRLVKAHLGGATTVLVRKVPASAIPQIKTGQWSDGRLARDIYDAVRQIPAGKVATYGDVAIVVGCSPRQVGFWLHRNPNPQTIPCHRVVFADGSLAPAFAFGGSSGQAKKLLSEGVEVVSGRVSVTKWRTGLSNA